VLRLFSKKKTPLSLEQLGLEEEDRELLERIAGRPNGLILVTGPTGSGKTTSLNAVLQHLKSDSQKIITIEDPIEYLIDGVNQIQTNDRIGLSFDTILRRVLRQDPNIIMVGEIRDSQTAELAIRASLTGHLVLSTLHTRDSVSVITRLKNMQIEPYLIAAVLRGSMAQRLVRRVCPDCRRRRKATRAEAALLRGQGLEEGPVYEGRGCKTCHQSGFRGRSGVFELFESSAEVEEMIVCGKRDTEIRSYLASRGMKPLLVDGFRKVLQGQTTVSEIERAIEG
jgi:type II secretory ATPase GspE/PulE/Tfp pilus assembly ATPase PilB-like protein